ncbi:ribose-5-phosphate isomerase A, partial [Sulfitobacter sp. CW3]|nr:ribose-5-phosphate isomerase A [Sulfitobacter sp. CW3]
TEHGNLVLDCEFGSIEEPAALARSLSKIPGVL